MILNVVEWRMVDKRICVNPLKLEFTIVIFIHYKSRIAVAILDL